MEQHKRSNLLRAFGQRLPFLTGLFISSAAFYVLFRIFRKHDFGEILHQLDRLPQELLLFALAITAIDYFILSGYDLFSIRYIKKYLPYPKIAIASFVAYSFSHTLGFPLLTGGAVRYRLYSSWGLTPQEIAKTVLFNIITFWLGVFVLGAVVLITSPSILHSSFFSFPLAGLTRSLGFLLAAIAAAYMIWSSRARKPISIRGRKLEPPGFWIACGQLIVSTANWVSASLVVYVLLNPFLDISYPSFVCIYFLGQAVAAASHVPGGLGVFESVVLLFAPKDAQAAALAALVAYRAIYFFFPLSISSIVFGFLQFVRKRAAQPS